MKKVVLNFFQNCLENRQLTSEHWMLNDLKETFLGIKTFWTWMQQSVLVKSRINPIYNL